MELVSCVGGALLIDEIENGLHYSVQPALWQFLGRRAEEYDVQIVATTHSYELIRTALELFLDRPDVLGLFRIDLLPERHVVVSYNADAKQGVLQTGFEVR